MQLLRNNGSVFVFCYTRCSLRIHCFFPRQYSEFPLIHFQEKEQKNFFPFNNSALKFKASAIFFRIYILLTRIAFFFSKKYICFVRSISLQIYFGITFNAYIAQINYCFVCTRKLHTQNVYYVQLSNMFASFDVMDAQRYDWKSIFTASLHSKWCLLHSFHPLNVLKFCFRGFFMTKSMNNMLVKMRLLLYREHWHESSTHKVNCNFYGFSKQTEKWEQNFFHTFLSSLKQKHVNWRKSIEIWQKIRKL